MSVYPEKRSGRHTGRWVAEVMVDGKKHRTRTSTIEEAREAERAFKEGHEPIAKVRSSSRRMTLGQLLVTAQESIWGHTKDWKGSMNQAARVVEILGEGTPIQDINNLTVDRLKAELSHLKPATINRHISKLSALLRYADRRGFLPQGLPSIDWLQEPPTEIRSLRDQEIAVLLAKSGEVYADLWIVLLHTGARVSEVLGLRPEDRDNGILVFGDTKNGDQRIVPETPEVTQILDKRLPWGISYWEARNEWDRVRASMGLQEDTRFTIHALRRTAATRLLQNKENLAVAKRLLGHRNIKTTLKYSAVEVEDLKSAVDVLSAVTR